MISVRLIVREIMPGRNSSAKGGAGPPVRSVGVTDHSSDVGASSELARQINRDILLEIIRLHQPLSRVEVSRWSGLQPSTVSAIVEQLIAERWVREGAVVRPSRGRPSTMLSLNDDLVTAAVDIRPDRAIVAVIDLSGRFLSRETVVTVSDPLESISRIKQRIKALQQLHSDKIFEGAGVSIPGRIDRNTQRLLLAPNLHWEKLDVKAVFEKDLGMQVEIDNDANACLSSELWFGRLKGVREAVLVAVGEGLGAAILMNGKIQSGHDGMAGEFGHISIDPNGPLCACGQRGCWETFATSRASLQAYSEHVPNSGIHTLGQLLRLSEEGDEHATAAISSQMTAIGSGLRLITAALSPERILITGEITACWSKLGHLVRQKLESGMLAGEPPKLIVAGDGELARLSGASAMLLRRHAGYRRSVKRGGQKGKAQTPKVAEKPRTPGAQVRKRGAAIGTGTS